MFKGKAGLTKIMKDAIERVIKAKEELDEILVEFENLKTEYDEVYEEYVKLAKKLKDHDENKGTLFSQEDIDRFAELKKKLDDLKAQMKKANLEYKKAMAKYTAAKAAAKTTMQRIETLDKLQEEARLNKEYKFLLKKQHSDTLIDGGSKEDMRLSLRKCDDLSKRMVITLDQNPIYKDIREKYMFHFRENQKAEESNGK